MSLHEPPRFSPGQILEAAHRAEGDGRLDIARQFYTHLVTNYSAQPEGDAAARALDRLKQTGTPVPPEPLRPPSAEPPRFEPLPSAHAAVEPQIGYRPEPAFNGWQQPAPHLPAAIPSSRPEERTPVELPPPIRDYRTARTLARLITWLGAIQLLVAVGILPIALLSPRTLAGLPLAGPLLAAPAVVGSLAMAGVFQILLGQLVRALLDQANATRDLAAISRAQATPPGEHEPRPRQRGRGRRK